MLKMKTLTIGDKTYQVWDPEAARIDDAAVGENVWSSQKLVESFCPERTARGEAVTIHPMAGTALAVTSRIRVNQTGSGEPSMTNVRPFVPVAELTLTQESDHETRLYTAQLGQEVYCGSFDWTSGILTLTHKLLTLTGEEGNWLKHSTTTILNHALFSDSRKNTSNVYGYCSHTFTRADGVINYNYVHKANSTKGFEAYVSTWKLPDNEVATWTNFLKEQAAAGTPIQVLYEIDTPLTVALPPQTLTALPGENRISCPEAETELTYRADPRVLLETLCIE